MASGDGDDGNGGGGDGTDTDTDTKSTHQTAKMLTYCLQMKAHHFFIVPSVEQMTGNHDTCQMTVYLQRLRINQSCEFPCASVDKSCREKSR